MPASASNPVEAAIQENEGGGYDFLRSELDPERERELEELSRQVLDECPESLPDELLEEAGYREEAYSDEDADYLKATSAALKGLVVDQVAYDEFFQPKIEFEDRLLDRIGSEEGYDSSEDLDVLKALRDGVLYDEVWRYANDKESILKDENEYAQAVMADVYFRGGKGLRSTLAQVTDYALTGEVSYETILMGASIELLHTSTLLQDDFLDGDEKRRGWASDPEMNSWKYDYTGEMLAVLDGNEMETWTNQMNVIAENRLEMEIGEESAEHFGEMQQELNRGQRSDMIGEWNGKDLEDASVQEYVDMSFGKTGALYFGAMSMTTEHVLNRARRRRLPEGLTERLAGLAEKIGKEEQVEKFLGKKVFRNRFLDRLDSKREAARRKDELERLQESFARRFNAAFQGWDDFIEVYYGEEETGKSVTDIPQRKNILPVILARDHLAEENSDLKRELEELYDNWREQGEAVDNAVDEEVLKEAADERIYDIMGKVREDIESDIREVASNAQNHVDRLEEEGFYNERGAEFYRMMAEAVVHRKK